MNQKNRKDRRSSPSSESQFNGYRVGDVMTSRVATALPGEAVSHVARRMMECDCGSLPVVDETLRPVGMITDRDIALFIAPRGLDAERVEVRECMTDEVVTSKMDDPIDRCLEIMARHQVRRVPVVNERGAIVGIVSQADLARHAEAHAGNGERRAVASTVSAISEPCRRS